MKNSVTKLYPHFTFKNTTLHKLQSHKIVDLNKCP